jgi:hypothetical protein
VWPGVRRAGRQGRARRWRRASGAARRRLDQVKGDSAEVAVGSSKPVSP